jgi:FkbM family methyltransferase
MKNIPDSGMNRHEGVSITTVIRAVVPRIVRNWVRSPSRSFEWLWDSARFWLGSTEILRLSPEWSIVCHPRAYKVGYQAQISDPEQRDEFHSFMSHCRPDMLLFDIGAHFGMFSLAAAHFGGRAIAVDPSKAAVRMIGIQTNLNQCAERIQAVLAAVSEANGIMGLLSSGVYSNGYLRVAKGRSTRELTSVPTVTIDHLVERYGSPTHLKIDVEGHETAVLRGGRIALTRTSPLVFLELHNEMVASEGGDPSSALQELIALGYHTFSSRGKSIDAHEILERPIIRVVARRDCP